MIGLSKEVSTKQKLPVALHKSFISEKANFSDIQ